MNKAIATETKRYILSIDEKTIKAALLKGERVTLECKTAQTNVPADVWRSYSAFANTYGGLMLLGVHEDLNMFCMIGFGENLGSGFPLILSAWNEKHWLKPELIEQRELMQVKLVLSIETKDVGKDVGKEQPNFGKELPDDLLTQLADRQIEMLGMIVSDSTISAKAISEKVSEKESITERTIERDLAKLKSWGSLSEKEAARTVNGF